RRRECRSALLPSPLGGEGQKKYSVLSTQYSVLRTQDSVLLLPLTPDPSPPRGEGRRNGQPQCGILLKLIWARQRRQVARTAGSGSSRPQAARAWLTAGCPDQFEVARSSAACCRSAGVPWRSSIRRCWTCAGAADGAGAAAGRDGA